MKEWIDFFYELINKILNVLIIVSIVIMVIFVIKTDTGKYSRDIIVRTRDNYTLKITSIDDTYTITLDNNEENCFKEDIVIPTETIKDRYSFYVNWYEDRVNVTYISNTSDYTYNKDIMLDKTKAD